MAVRNTISTIFAQCLRILYIWTPWVKSIQFPNRKMDLLIYNMFSEYNSTSTPVMFQVQFLILSSWWQGTDKNYIWKSLCPLNGVLIELLAPSQVSGFTIYKASYSSSSFKMVYLRASSSFHYSLVFEERNQDLFIGNVELLELDSSLVFTSLFLPTRIRIQQMAILSLFQN